MTKLVEYVPDDPPERRPKPKQVPGFKPKRPARRVYPKRRFYPTPRNTPDIDLMKLEARDGLFCTCGARKTDGACMNCIGVDWYA